MIGKPSAKPYVDEDDLTALVAEFGAGWVPVATLYDLYLRQVSKDPARVPMTKAGFARVMTEAKWHASTKYVDGAVSRCRLITRSAVRKARDRLGPDWEDDFGTSEELEGTWARKDNPADYEGDPDFDFSPQADSAPSTGHQA